MHLVGYLYEDYHDARSLEHKVTKFLIHTINLQHFMETEYSLLRNDPPLVPVQRKINPFRSLPPYFLKIHSHITLPNISSSYKLSVTRFNCDPLFLYLLMLQKQSRLSEMEVSALKQLLNCFKQQSQFKDWVCCFPSGEMEKSFIFLHSVFWKTSKNIT
jgi:hypothetical protein